MIVFPQPYMPPLPPLPSNADSDATAQHTRECDTMERMADKLNKEKIKEYQTNTIKLGNSLRTLFKVIVGQSNESVHGRPVDTTDFFTNRSTGDCVWLLSRIQTVVINLE